ncbi:MAG: chromosomal replication initiator protein, partial [Thermoleophilaceae bacterium]|nr:chromosomal replication initiator protein [Thermoleophilaceae bacterium]
MPQPAGSEPPLPDALAGAWDRLSRELRREVTDFTFHIWLEPLAPVGHVGGTLFLRAPDHIRTWVEDSFLPVLRRAAA